MIEIFLSEALEIYYYDTQDKPLYSFLEFVGPGVHVDEVSKTMCARYMCVMDAISMQMFYRELFVFLRWAYSVGYTERNLVYRIKS